MTFHWNIDFGQLIMSLTFLGGVFVFIWRARGWFDTVQEHMKQRHRQNTQRMDFLLEILNADRELRGLPKLTCPYRLIIDP